MNIKERILKELEEQEKTEGKTAKTDIIRYFLKKIKTSSQFNAFIICKWVNNKRFYYPSEELINICTD